MSKPTFLGPLIGKGVGQCELVYAERGAVLATRVEPAFDSKARKKGLLGRESIPEDYALIIAPCSAVHTISMRVPIDLVFVTKNGTITKTYRGVKPWRIAGSLGAHAVIEAAEGFIDQHEIVPGEVVALQATERGGPDEEGKPAVEPAPDAKAPAAHGHHTTSRKRATLAAVVASESPLAWFESVAIVQELCETVLTRGPIDDLRIPELKHIVLDADGGVSLLADGPSGHSPVQRAGLVLLALTPEDQLPMQLRLFVLEEVSPRPRLQSLNELHRELEFFERPDRQSFVRQVHDRFRRQRGAAAAEPAVPPALLEPPPPRRLHRWWRERSFWAGTGVVLLTLAVASIVWAWPRPEGKWLREGVGRISRVSSAVTQRVIAAARRGWDESRERIASRPRLARADMPVVALPPERATTPIPGISPGGGTPPPVIPGDFAGRPPSAQVPAASAPLVASSAPQGGPAQGVVASVNASKALYSEEDAPLVAPPMLVSPRVSTARATETAPAEAPVVELVISASGEVESVKLVSGQTTALSGMQISAVKAWRFQPATRDGQPVRYRFRLQLPAK